MFSLHEGADEVHGAVVERAVVGVVADAVAVEGEEDVDCGGGGRVVLIVAVFGGALAEGFVAGVAGVLRGEGVGQEVGDIGLAPLGGHAIWEAGGVVDDVDV